MGKTYFASDFHLGVDARHSSAARERFIVSWLDQIRLTADAIYLAGDLFDYWFEYREVIPKGSIRLLGKLAQLRDEGIPIFAFTGNHDMWMFGYFEEELDIPVYRTPIRRKILGSQFLIGHGDGLGPGDYGYKFIKRVFAHRVSQWLFARLHPNSGIRLMRYFSGQSRETTAVSEFLGEDKEWLIQYCRKKLKTDDIDYFVFGHRHLPIDYHLPNGKARYINLGDWLTHYTYGVFDEDGFRIERFPVHT